MKGHKQEGRARKNGEIAFDDLGASPARISNPELRYEAKRALVWAFVVGLVLLAVYLWQAVLIIFAALVFAAVVDGAARLLGKALPTGRAWRITLVLMAMAAGLAWLIQFAGSQIAHQAEQLPQILESQTALLFDWLDLRGVELTMSDVRGTVNDLTGGMGTLTAAIGGFLGAFATTVLIIFIGIYVVYEPMLYERGLAWMLPAHSRREFHRTVLHMAAALRRLLAGRIVGMAIEGFLTYALLAIWGVPMAALLGLLTAALAFIPNIGALASGTLMVLVGFSDGLDTGLYTIFVYFFVQTLDGYVIVPMIARKAVDLAPALVLSVQLIMGLLFGIMGLLLADPLLAMAKVALEERARHNRELAQSGGAAQSPQVAGDAAQSIGENN